MRAGTVAGRVRRVTLGAFLAMVVTTSWQIEPGNLAAGTPRAHAGGTLSVTSTVGDQPGGVPGTSVTLAASPGSLTPGSTLLVGFADVAHNPAQSFFPSQHPAADGSLTLTGVVLPMHAARGPLTVTITDSGTPSLSVTGTFTIVPFLQFAGRTDGSPGDVISVVGGGFATYAPISFSIAGLPASPSAGAITATADGQVVATLLVPAGAAPGPTSLVAADGAGTPPALPFTVDAPVAPTGTPTPTAIASPIGTATMIDTATLVATATSSATATSTVTWTATPTIATATPSATATPAGTVTILPAAQIPGNAVSVMAPAGMFPGNATVTLLFLDATSTNPAHALGTAQTAANGSLSQSVALPAQATNGKATIEVLSSLGTFGATVFIGAVLADTPATVSAGAPFTLSGDGFNSLKSMSFTLNGVSLASPSPVVTSALGHFDVSLVVPLTVAASAATLSASDGTTGGMAAIQLHVNASSSGPGASPTPNATTNATAPPLPIQPGIAATPAPSPLFTVYFAEGFTGSAATNGKASFDETLSLLNPASNPVNTTITYIVQGESTPRQIQRLVPAHAVLREPVNADVGSDRAVSAVVTSMQWLAVSRIITRVNARGTRLDGSQSEGATEAATIWGFPEGYTGVSFQEYLTLLDPGTTPAHVRVVLAPQASSSAGARSTDVTVPALGRATVNIRALNQPGGTASVGMLVSSDLPVVAERVEYFGEGSGSGKFGALVSRGFTKPGTTLHIAYGSSGGSQLDKHGVLTATGNQMYVTVLNPSQSGAPVHATLTVSNAAGSVAGTPYSLDLAPTTRQTVALNTLLGKNALSSFSISIQASGPVEAEGAQYIGGSPNSGHHPGMVFPALPAPITSAYLADVSTRLPSGAQVRRLVLVYGAASHSFQIQAAYYGQTGPGPSATYTVPAGGILTIDVNQDTAGMKGRGPIAMSITTAPGSTGAFVAVTTGVTHDGLSALGGTGVAGP